MGLTVRELYPETAVVHGAESVHHPDWFALTVKHQHERGVEAALKAWRLDAFLPTYRLRRRWSDRLKELEAPLFPGYVFGRFGPAERVRVLRIPGVARVVGFGGMPAPVAEKEIDAIRLALASKLPIGPWPYPKTGDRVRVEAGPLRGVEGVLLGNKDKLRLVLSVQLLQRSVAVEVAADEIAPVRQ